ncbi:hypothetical protein MASR2M78_37130 [Treponema sp.]
MPAARELSNKNNLSSLISLSITVGLPDTNSILRYLLKDHPDLPSRATEFWESVREGHSIAILTEGVILECVYVLQRFYKVPRKKITPEIGILLSYKGLRKDGIHIFSKALEIYQSGSIDFVDCLHITQEIVGIGQVFSFDKDIKKILDTITPKILPE